MATGKPTMDASDNPLSVDSTADTDGNPVNDESAADGPGDLLKSTLGASTIITAWIFVLGWTYLHTYYAYFGININSLSFPVYYYPVFVFTQFVSFHWNGLFLGALIIAVFGLAWFGNRVRRILWGSLIGLGFLVIFWLGFVVAVGNATDAAKDDMDSNKSTLPSVSIELDHPHSFLNGDIDTVIGSPNVRLLLEDRDHLFVFIPTDTTQPNVTLHVVALDRSGILASIRTVRVQ